MTIETEIGIVDINDSRSFLHLKNKKRMNFERYMATYFVQAMMHLKNNIIDKKHNDS